MNIIPPKSEDKVQETKQKSKMDHICQNYCHIIKLDPKLKLSNPDFHLTIKCDKSRWSINQLSDDNLAYPSTFELSQLASKSCMVKKDEESIANYKARLQLPTSWDILTTASHKSKRNNYFGVAFWNSQRRQIVISHRGTSAPNGNDFTTLFGGNYLHQLYSACTFGSRIQKTLEELQQDDVHVFFTGYSLGGWLAQVTTFSHKYLEADGPFLVKRQSEGCRAHTEVFDSPGCLEILSQLAEHFGVVLMSLDITNFLEAPNVVNCCSKHAGMVCRIFTGDINRSPDRIANVFDADASELKIHQVVEWPTWLECADFQTWILKFQHDLPDNTNEEFLPNPQHEPIRYHTKKYNPQQFNINMLTHEEHLVLKKLKLLENVPGVLKSIFVESIQCFEIVKFRLEEINVIGSLVEGNFRSIVPFFRRLLPLSANLHTIIETSLANVEVIIHLYKHVSNMNHNNLGNITKYLKDDLCLEELSNFLNDASQKLCQITSQNIDIVTAQIVQSCSKSYQVLCFDISQLHELDSLSCLKGFIVDSEVNLLFIIKCEELLDQTKELIDSTLTIFEYNSKVKIIVLCSGTSVCFKELNLGELKWDDLSEYGKYKFLHDPFVRFQGADDRVSLSAIIGLCDENKDSYFNCFSEILDSSTLIKFIKGDEFTIGQSVEGLGELSDCYVKRVFELSVPISSNIFFSRNPSVNVVAISASSRKKMYRNYCLSWEDIEEFNADEEDQNDDMEEETRSRGDEKRINQGEKRINEGEKRINEGEKRLNEDDKSIREVEKRVNEDEKIVNEDEKIVNEDEKIVNEDEKIVNEDEKIVNEDEKIVNEDEKIVKEDEKRLNEDEKRLNEDEKRLNYDEKSLNEDEKGLNEDEKRLNEDEKRLNEDEKRLNEDEKMLNEDEKWLNEDEKWLNEEEKWLNEEERRLNEEERTLNIEERTLNIEERTLNIEEKRGNGEEKRLNEEEKRLNEEEKTLNDDEKRITENEKRITENEKRITEDEKRITEDEKRINEGENTKNEGKNRIYKDEKKRIEMEKRMNEDEKSINERERRINEDEKVINEYGKAVNEFSKKGNEDAKSINEDTKRLNEFEKKVNEDDKRLNEDDKRLNEDDKRLNEDDKRLNEDDKRLNEDDKRLNEDDKRLNEDDKRLNEDDKRLNEDDKRLNEDDKRLNEDDKRLNEDDKRLNEDDKRLNEDDKRLNEVDKRLNEDDKRLNEDDKRLNEDDKRLNEDDKRLNEDDKRLNEDDKRLNEDDKRLNEDDKRLNEDDKRLNEDDKRLNEDEKRINENEKRINENEKRINENEKRINENEKRINENEKRINENEKRINENEKSINEDKMMTTEDTMKTTEDTMKTTKDTMRTTENTIEIKEDTMTTTEDTIETKEDAINIKEDAIMKYEVAKQEEEMKVEDNMTIAKDEMMEKEDEVTREEDKVKIQGDGMTKEEDEVTKEEDEVTKEEDEVTKEEDERTKEEDERTKEEDERTKEEDERTKEEDERTKEEDERTKEEDERTKEEDEGTKEEDEGTKEEDDISKEEDETERGVKVKVIVLNSKDGHAGFQKLTKHKKFSEIQNFHWVEDRSGDLFWLETVGSTEILHEQVINSKSLLHPLGNAGDGGTVFTSLLTESDMIQRIGKTKALILPDTVGNGKSTTVARFAHEVKKLNPDQWVIPVYLNDCLQALKEVKRSSIKSTKDGFLDFLADGIMSCNNKTKLRTKFEKELLKFSIAKSGRVVLFIDAWDKINPDFENSFYELLKKLKETSIKIFVTTDSETNYEVKCALSSYVTYELRPFSDEDQIEYLMKCWSKNFPELEDIKTTAKLLVNSLTESTLAWKELIGVPLQCKLMAEAYHVSGANSPQPKWTLYKLYRNFIARRFLKSKQRVKQLHQLLALKLLLNDGQHEKLNFKISKTKVKQITQHGIVKLDENPEFIHHTFADYFMAEYFASLLGCPSETTLEILIKNILLEDSFKLVRYFLNCILQEAENSSCNDNFSDMLVSLWSEKGHSLRSDSGETALHICVEENLESVFKFLINCSLRDDNTAMKLVSFISARDYSNNALNNAASNDKEVLIEHFLNKLYALNDRTKRIYILALTFNVDTDNELLDVLQDSVDTPLKAIAQDVRDSIPIIKEFHTAADRGSVWVLRRIMREIDDEDLRHYLFLAINDDRKTALHLSIEGSHFESARFLLEDFESALPYLATPPYFPPLTTAVDWGNIEMVELILSLGGNMNNEEVLKDRKTICNPISSNRLDIALLLVNNGFDVYVKNEEGASLLHFSADSSNEDMVKLFLNFIDVNDRDNKNRTPLHYACTSSTEGTTLFLLQNGADIDASDHKGNTPLHRAAKFSYSANPAIIAALIAHGANLQAKNNVNKTPFEVATYEDNIIAFLRHVPSCLNVPSDLRERYFSLAMSQVLSEEQLQMLEIVAPEDMEGPFITKEDEKLKFTNNIWGEYFAAQYTVDTLNTDRTSDYLEELLLTEVLLKHEYPSLRTFIDFLLENVTMNDEVMKVIGGRIVKFWVQKPENLISYHESALHIAVRDRRCHILEFLLKCFVLQDDSDSVVNFISANNFCRQSALYLAFQEYHMHKEFANYLELCPVPVRKQLLMTSVFIPDQPMNDFFSLLRLIENYPALRDIAADMVQRRDLVNRMFEAAERDDDLQSIFNLADDETKKYVLGVVRYTEDMSDMFWQCSYSVLNFASNNGNLESVRFLIDAGAAVDSVRPNDEDNRPVIPPIFTAIKSGNLDVVKLLLDKGADAKVICEGWTSVKIAVEFRSNEILEFLIREPTCCDSQRALHIAVRKGFSDTAVLLMENGVDVNELDDSSDSPLHLAAAKGNHEIVETLLAKGADINLKDSLENTALHDAAHNLNLEVVRVLLEHGMDANVRSDKAPLHSATDPNEAYVDGTQEKCIQVVKLLLSHGADINVLDNSKRTPLHEASGLMGFDFHELVQVLLENGAEPNCSDNKNATPLHYAARYDNLEVVKKLLAFGADPNALDDQNDTALDLAKESQRRKIIRVLSGL